jgi:hypothetical protein
MGRASEIAKEIEIYEGLLDYAEIKSLKSSLIATAKNLITNDFSRKDQSDLRGRSLAIFIFLKEEPSRLQITSSLAAKKFMTLWSSRNRNWNANL